MFTLTDINKVFTFHKTIAEWSKDIDVPSGYYIDIDVYQDCVHIQYTDNCGYYQDYCILLAAEHLIDKESFLNGVKELNDIRDSKEEKERLEKMQKVAEIIKREELAKLKELNEKYGGV